MPASPARHLRVVSPDEKPVERLGFKSGGLFVAINLLAGGFHYLYQAVASRELTIGDFSALNAWYANLSIFLALPMFLQYLANFLPLSTTRLRTNVVVVNMAMLSIAGLFFMSDGHLNVGSATLILAAAALYGWLSGQAQSRLLLGALAISGLLVGVFKLAMLALPMTPRIEVYAAALIVSYVPAVWFLSVGLWREQRLQPRVQITLVTLAAPALLSLASAVFPQMDLVLLNLTQKRDVFAQFALASLFYKALYFVVFAYLQWLLPQQVRAPGARLRWQPFVAAMGIGGILSVLAAELGPLLGQLILKWEVAPPFLMIFLSCMNTCLLTWLFVQIQSECAAGRPQRVLAVSLVLALEFGLQLMLRLEVNNYLFLAIVFQMIAIVLLSRDSTATQSPGLKSQGAQ